jgi:hypothetical protein
VNEFYKLKFAWTFLFFFCRSDVMQLDNSLDMEKDQEQQLEQQLEVNMSIPTTPLKSRFDLMDQITIPVKKRTAFRRMFA